MLFIFDHLVTDACTLIDRRGVHFTLNPCFSTLIFRHYIFICLFIMWTDLSEITALKLNIREMETKLRRNSHALRDRDKTSALLMTQVHRRANPPFYSHPQYFWQIYVDPVANNAAGRDDWRRAAQGRGGGAGVFALLRVHPLLTPTVRNEAGKRRILELEGIVTDLQQRISELEVPGRISISRIDVSISGESSGGAPRLRLVHMINTCDV